jgi:hypothetical protein
MITDEVCRPIQRHKQFPNDRSNLRKIIRIEEIGEFQNCLCKRKVEGTWVLFIDVNTKSSGIMPEEQLNQLYERMDGFTSNGKELYIERRAR